MITRRGKHIALRADGIEWEVPASELGAVEAAKEEDGGLWSGSDADGITLTLRRVAKHDRSWL
eukprot:2911873-Pyramimonas_sp.AAC.1